MHTLVQVISVPCLLSFLLAYSPEQVSDWHNVRFFHRSGFLIGSISFAAPIRKIKPLALSSETDGAVEQEILPAKQLQVRRHTAWQTQVIYFIIIQ